MNITELLNEIEDEHEVILKSVEKSSINLLKFIRDEFGLAPLKAKEYLMHERVLYSNLKLANAEEKAQTLINLGANIEIYEDIKLENEVEIELRT